VKAAVDLARAGGGPTLVEAKTYRFQPHTSDDDDRTYRSREEVDEWKAKDPILLFERYLEANGLAGPEHFEEARQKARDQISDAVQYAQDAPFAPSESVLRQVFAEEDDRGA
jgi:2-oxoisovalerate dehydrogenase E1 component alpha subunit